MHGYYLLEMYYMKVLKSVNTSKLDILQTSLTLKAMPNNIEKGKNIGITTSIQFSTLE